MASNLLSDRKLAACSELSESEEELVQGGAAGNSRLSSGSQTFWGVRTAGGILTIQWNPETRTFSVNYQWLWKREHC